MRHLRALRKSARKLRRQVRRLREQGHLRRWRRARHLLQKDLNAIHRFEEAHREGVDSAYGRPSPESLLEAGKDFFAGYLNEIPGFGLSEADVERYGAGGIDLVAIYERGHEDPLEGRKRGEEHARDAIAEAIDLKIPPGRPIFFAVDFEAKGPDIGAYFVGVNNVVRKSRYRVGGYGSYRVMKYLFDEELIEWGFQTYAWSYDYEKDQRMWEPRAHLRQTLINLPGNELIIGGSKVDYCRTLAKDFGQWKVKTTT